MPQHTDCTVACSRTNRHLLIRPARRDRFTFTVRKDCTSDASTSGRDEPGGSPAGLSPRGPRAGSRRIELEVNLPGAAGKSPAGSADGNGAAGDDAETWRKVAEEVARIQASARFVWRCQARLVIYRVNHLVTGMVVLSNTCASAANVAVARE